MGHLFDYELPGATNRAALKRELAVKQHDDPAVQHDAPFQIWQQLLDAGADPLVLAALLQKDLSPAERRRAYLELVRDVGGPLASVVLAQAAPGVERRAFPVAIREIAETASGRPLVGIHMVTGRLVELIAQKLDTTAFTLGSEVFVRGGSDGSCEAVLVHEALHASQQQDASPAMKLRRADGDAESDVHRMLRRLGPVSGRTGMVRERARAATAVSSALGRAPRVASRRPTELAAYEPTPIQLDKKQVLQLAEALLVLLHKGASAGEVKSVLGPQDDPHSAELRQAALAKIDETPAGGQARARLSSLLGTEAALYLNQLGKLIPEAIRAALEPKLGVSLAGVRLHDDATAAARAQAVGATAFTEGKNVFFADGKLDPSTKDGQHLLAHELAHVAQQAGQPTGRDASEPGSAVEHEAERVAQAVSRGAAAGDSDLKVKETAAAGTISRDDGKSKPSGPWNVQFLQQALNVDLATATDWANGMKKLTLPLGKVGPVNLNELTVKLDDSGKPERGELKATVDDGVFKGSAATLQIDQQGKVTGSLDIAINLPGVLAKTVKLAVTPEGLSASVSLGSGDFLSKEFPVTSSGISITVKQTPTGLDVQLVGSAQVGLDAGFAEGKGTLTAKLTTAGALSMAAEIAATFNVPGLGAAAAATLKWDGKKVDVEGTASVDVSVPGLSGKASISYVDGKLKGDIPELKFTTPSFAGLKFEGVGISEGKLKGTVKVASDTTFPVGLATVVLKADSSLSVDGAKVTGEANGTIKLGDVLEGEFNLGYGEGGLDGNITVGTSKVPFLSVSGLKLTAKGLGGANTIGIGGGTITVDAGIATGSMTNLGWSGGSLTGDVGLQVTLPGVDIPEIQFSVLPGWKIQSKAPKSKASIMLSEALGKLEQLAIEIKTAGGDLKNLPKALGDISLSATSITPPGLANIGTLDSLDIHIPSNGGTYSLATATGSAQITVKLGSETVNVAVGLKGGKLSASAHSNIDIAKLVPGLKGQLAVGVDTDKTPLVTVEATGVSAANPELAKALTISSVKFADGKLTGAADFGGKVSLGGWDLTVKQGHLDLDSSATPKLKGEASFGIAGDTTSAEVKVKIGSDGTPEITGGLELDLHTLSEDLTGKIKLKGGTATGLQTFEATGCSYKKDPFGTVEIKSVKYDRGSGDFEAAVSLAKDKFSIGGVTIDSFKSEVTVKKGAGGVGLEGTVSGGVTVQLGQQIGKGKIDLSYKGGKLSGSVSMDSVTLKLGTATVKADAFKISLDENGKIDASSKAKLSISQPGLFDMSLQANLDATGITGFTVDGTVGATTVTKEASLKGFTWDKGAGLSGSAEITLTTLGGLIDPETKITLGYDGSKFTAKTSKIKVNTGMLAGWSFEGGLDAGKFSAAVEAPEGAWNLGGTKITLAKGTKLSWGAGGFSGNLDGGIEFNGNEIKVAVTITDNVVKSVKASAKIDLHTVIPQLKGDVEVGYDGSKVKISATNVTASDPDIGKNLKVTVNYDDGKFTGSADFSGSIKLQGLEVEVVSGHLAVDSSATPKITGTATFKIKGAKDSKADIKVSYKADGTLNIEGGLTIDLSTISGDMTGVIKAKGGSATGLQEFEATDCSYKKDPFGTLTLKSVKYDRSSGDFSAKVTLDPTKFSVGGVTVTDFSGDIGVSKSAGGVDFDGHVSGNISVDVSPQVGKGKIDLTYAAGKLTGYVQLTSVDLKFGDAQVGIDNFKLGLKEGGKLDAGGKASITVKKPGLLDVKLTAEVGESGITGFTVDGTIEKTPITESVKLNGITWQKGKGITGSCEIALNDLGGLIDSGTKMTVGYDGAAWTAKVSKTTIKAPSILAGWSFEGGLDGGAFAATVTAPGGTWNVGGFDVTMDAGSTVTYAGGQVSGKVGGKVAMGESQLGLSVSVANNKITSVAVSGDVNLHKFVSELEGTVSGSYDGGKITVTATGVKLSDPELGKYLTIDKLVYADGSISGKVTAATGHVVIGPIEGKINSCSLSFSFPKGGAKTFAGDLDIELSATDGSAAGHAKLSYDGKKFDWSGDVSIEAAKVTDGWVTGTLKIAKGATGSSYAGEKLNFGKGPLAGKIKDFSASYASADKSFSAEITLTSALIEEFLPANVTAKAEVTLSVAKKGAGKLEVHAKGGGKVSVPLDAGEYFSGTLSIGYENDKFSLGVSAIKVKVETEAIKVKADGFGFEIEDKKFKVTAGGTLGFEVYDMVSGTATIDADGGAISGISVDATLKETEFTTSAKIAGSYKKGGAWSAEADVGVKDIGGLIGDNTKLHAAISKEKGVNVSVTNAELGGMLKGFKIDKAEIGKGVFNATVSGGATIDIADGFAATIDPSTKITLDNKAGITGNLKATLDLGPVKGVEVTAELRGKAMPKVHAEKKGLDLKELSDNMVTGVVDLSYDGNLKKGIFKVAVAQPKIVGVEDANFIESLKAQYGTSGGFAGSLVLVAGKEFEYQGNKLKIVKGDVKFASKKLNGSVSVTFAGEDVAGGIELSIKDNILKGDIEADINLIGISKGWIDGKAHVKAGSGGAAIDLGPEGASFKKDPLIGISITKLSGDSKGKNLTIGIDAVKFLAKKAEGLEGVTLTPTEGHANLSLADGVFSADGKIGGKFELTPGGKPMASGTLEAGYDGTKLFAKLHVVSFTAGDGAVTGKGIVIDTDEGLSAGTLEVNIPGVLKGDVTNPTFNPKAKVYAFDATCKFDPKLGALSKVGVEAHLKDGVFSAKAKLESDIDEVIGPVTLKIKADGTNVALVGKKVSAHVAGEAKVDGDIASGSFGFDLNGTSLEGTINAKVGSKITAFEEGSPVNIAYKGGKLDVDADLTLGSAVKKYFAGGGTVKLHIHGTAITVDGQILGPIPQLGKIGEGFKSADVSYKGGKITAHGKIDLSKAGDMFQAGSHAEFTFEDGKPSIVGDANLNVSGLPGAESAKVHLDWKSGEGFHLTGGFKAQVPDLGEVEVGVSLDSGSAAKPGASVAVPEGTELKFCLTGKVTATALAAKFPSVGFLEPPTALLKITNEGGKWDWGIDHLGTKINRIDGVDETDISFDASYTKGGGLNCSARVNTLRVGNLNFTGGVEIAKGKFVSGTLGVEADFPGVGLKAELIVSASELGGLSFMGKATVTPKGGGAIASFVKDGTIEIEFVKGKLVKAKGTVNLIPPDMFKLDNCVLEVEYTPTGGVKGHLHAGFTLPIGEGVKGDINIWVGGDEKFKATLSFPFEAPGCETANVFGEINAAGEVKIGASFKPKGAFKEWLKEVQIGIEYKQGFRVFGSVTITPSKDLEITLGVSLDVVTGAFDITGVPTTKQHDDNASAPAGLKKDLINNSIPLFGIGVLNVVLTLRASVGVALAKPKIEFDKPEFVGGLGAMKNGMPEIKFGGSFGLGVDLSLELGVGIAGQIQLLIASAEIGIEGVAKAILNLMIGADIKGSFKQGQGAVIDIDPFVAATLKIRAELNAFVHAEVCWFTIVDKHWPLAGVDLATIPLGSFKPFKPMKLKVGGPEGTSMSTPELNLDPDKITEGAKTGMAKAGDEESNKEAKQKIQPVLMKIKAAAPQFAELPPDWQNGIKAAPMDFSMFGISGSAWDFYRDHADQAETIAPEGACTSPIEKLAKAVAVYSKSNPYLAGMLVLEWRRAQIAHMGIDPETGTDVVKLQAEVVALQVAKYQADVDAAIAAQEAQDAEHKAAVEKQTADFAKAETDHATKENKIKQEHTQKVVQAENEGKEAVKKVDVAAKDAAKEGAQAKPTEKEKAPPPPAPPAPPPLPKLQKPAVIPEKPKIPIPVPPPPIPAVTKPALPSDPGASAPASKPVPPSAGGGKGGGAPPAPAASPGSPPASVPSKTSTAEAKGGGGAAMGAGGKGGGKGGGGGGGGGSGPGPVVAAGPQGIIVQHKTLDHKKEELGGGKGKPAAGGAPAAGAKPAAGAPAAGAPAAGAPAGATAGGTAGAAAGAGKTAGGGKAAGPDPTVAAVVEKGKADEDKQEKETKTKDDQFKKQIDEKKTVAGAAEAKLKEATVKQKAVNEKTKGDKEKKGGERKMPEAGEFPPATMEQMRAGFSNWTKLKSKGETWEGWKAKGPAHQHFDFEKKSWANIVAEFQKIFDTSKPEDPLPDPKEFADKLNGGQLYTGKDYKPAPGYDPAYSLSDEAIKAYTTLEKFKDLYKGNKPGEYLATEAEKLVEAQRTAYVNNTLTALVGGLDAQKALRLAIEKLGPASEVGKRLALIDSGKSVEAPAFWALVAAGFSTGSQGLSQVDAAIATLEKKQSESKKDDKKKDGPEKKDDPAAKKDEKKEPVKMMGWDEAAPKFEALAADKSYERALTDFGVVAGGDLAGNQALALAGKKKALAELKGQMKDAKPEQIHEKWLATMGAKEKAHNVAASGLSSAYAKVIQELRTKEPRLDQAAFAKACSTFRSRVGSNALVFTVGNVNPPEMKPEEKIDPSAAQASVGGADWNPMLKPDWVATYEKFDPKLFEDPEKKKEDEAKKKDEAKKDDPAAGKDAKDAAKPADGAAKPADPGAKPADGAKPAEAKKDPAAKPADGAKPGDPAAKPGDSAAKKDPAADAKKDGAKPEAKPDLPQAKDGGAKPDAAKDGPKPGDPAVAAGPDPVAVKAAEEKLKTVFVILGDKIPPKIATLKPEEKVALAAKADADIRTEYFHDFESLKAVMPTDTLEKAGQVDKEEGLAPGNEGLKEKFKTDVYAAFVKGGVGSDFESLFVNVGRKGYGSMGKPIDAAGFAAACKGDASLARGVGFHKFTKDVLDIAGAQAEMMVAKPGDKPGDDEAHKYVLDAIKKTPTSIKRWVTGGDKLVEYAGWFFPEPQIKSDAVYSEYIDLLALYSNWFPSGMVRMTLMREKVEAHVAAGGLKKPTVFDGLMSPLWMQRDNRDHNWGRTAGGLRECLLKCAWGDVDHGKWQVAGDDGVYAGVQKAALAQEEARKGKTKDPAADKAVGDHTKEMGDKAKGAQAEQRKEDAAAKDPPPGGAGGAGPGAKPGDAKPGDAKADAKPGDAKPGDAKADAGAKPTNVLPDAAEPIKKTFPMGGATHTLTADPKTKQIDMASKSGKIRDKFLEVIGAIPKLAEQITKFAEDEFKRLSAAAGKKLDKAIDKAVEVIPPALEEVKKTVKAAVDATNKAIQAAVSVGKGIVDEIEKALAKDEMQAQGDATEREKTNKDTTDKVEKLGTAVGVAPVKDLDKDTIEKDETDAAKLVVEPKAKEEKAKAEVAEKAGGEKKEGEGDKKDGAPESKKAGDDKKDASADKKEGATPESDKAIGAPVPVGAPKPAGPPPAAKGPAAGPGRPGQPAPSAGGPQQNDKRDRPATEKDPETHSASTAKVIGDPSKTVAEAAPKEERDSHFNPVEKVAFEKALAGALLAKPDMYSAQVASVSTAALAYLEKKLADGVKKGLAGAKEQFLADLSKLKADPGWWGAVEIAANLSKEELANLMRQSLVNGTIPQKLAAHQGFIAVLTDDFVAGIGKAFLGAGAVDPWYVRQQTKINDQGKLDKNGKNVFKGQKDKDGKPMWDGDESERGRVKRDDQGGSSEAGPGLEARKDDGAAPAGGENAGTPQQVNRGLDAFTMDEAKAFCQRARLQINMPIAAGISGSTAELINVAMTLGLSGNELQKYAIAVLGYVSGGGNHSFHEIMIVLAAAGVVDDPDTYAGVKPLIGDDMYKQLADAHPNAFKDPPPGASPAK